jgi:hypothetical protein
MMSAYTQHPADDTPPVAASIYVDSPEALALADVDQNDFVNHIMGEHGQFMALLETTYNTLAEFINGQTTIGALKRLAADINAALPATNPVGGAA